MDLVTAIHRSETNIGTHLELYLALISDVWLEAVGLDSVEPQAVVIAGERPWGIM